MGITFTSVAIYYTCLSWELFGHQDNSSIELTHLGITVSLFGVMANALQVLSLFVWKQIGVSIVYREHCSLITSSPYLKWYDGSNDFSKKNGKKSKQSMLGTSVEMNGSMWKSPVDVEIIAVIVEDDSRSP